MSEPEQREAAEAEQGELRGELFAEMVDWASIPVWVFDSSLTVVYGNRAARDYVVGSSFSSAISDFSADFQKVLTPLLRDCLKSHESLSADGWVVSDVRGKCYLHVVCVPLSGDLVGCVVVDRTGLKGAEEKAEQSSERYRLLVESMAEGLSAADEEGTIEFANPALERILGAKSGGLVGRTLADFAEGGAAALKDVQAEVRRLGRPLPCEMQISRTDNEVRDLLLSVNPRVDRYGQFIGYFTLTQDVTLHKRAEERLRESEERFRTLVESMREGVLIRDSDDRIVFVNDSMCQLVGYSRDELNGRSIYDFLDESGQQIVKNQLALREKGAASTYVLSIRRKDGQSVTTHVSAVPIMDREGKAAQSFGIFSELSESSEAGAPSQQ